VPKSQTNRFELDIFAFALSKNCLHVGKRMQALAKKLTHNRDRTYKHLLDVMPIYVVPIFLFLFFAVVAGGVLIGALLGPPIYGYTSASSTQPDIVTPFLNGSVYLVYEPNEGFRNLNQQLSISLILKNKFYNTSVGGFSMGFTKGDLAVHTVFEGRNAGGNNSWIPLNKYTSSYTQVLRCPQRSEYCMPITVAFLNYVPYSQYKISIALMNSAELYNDGMLDTYAMIQFEYVTDKYSRFEVGWRYTLLFIMIPFAAFYILYTFVRQPLIHWTTEQKWTAILLLLIFFYNNPIMGFEYVIDTWVISFLNNVFVATFISYLLFTILVTTHAAIKPLGERRFFFYIPKIVLVGIIWLFVIVALTYLAVKQKNDPSYNLTVANSVSGYEIVAIIVGLGVLAYILLLLYYLLRGIGYCMKIGGIPLQFRSRIVVVWLLTLTVVVGTIVNVFLYLFKKTWNNSAQFLSYFVLYNAYAYIIGIFYLPSFTEKKKVADEDDRAFIVEEEELQSME
jgi:hypothetical protein